MHLAPVPLQLVIYGLSGILVPQVDLQDQDSPAAVHNITQYIETVLIPGGPVTSLNTVLTAVNNGELDQVAAGFNTAVAHNYTSQIIAVVMEVSVCTCVKTWFCLSRHLCQACYVHLTKCRSGNACLALMSGSQVGFHCVS